MGLGWSEPPRRKGNVWGAVWMQGLGRDALCAGRIVVPSDCVQTPEGLAQDGQRWQGVVDSRDRRGDLVFTWTFAVAVTEGAVSAVWKIQGINVFRRLHLRARLVYGEGLFCDTASVSGRGAGQLQPWAASAL